jgi:hypothetical protein
VNRLTPLQITDQLLRRKRDLQNSLRSQAIQNGYLAVFWMVTDNWTIIHANHRANTGSLIDHFLIKIGELADRLFDLLSRPWCRLLIHLIPVVSGSRFYLGCRGAE